MKSSKEEITEHILSLILYALAEADMNNMENMMPILDEAAMKIITEYRRVYGTKETWEKCDKLYQEILDSIDSKNISKKIPQTKDIK